MSVGVQFSLLRDTNVPQVSATIAGVNGTRDELLAEYFRLTRDVLPARARAGRWVVRYDHCFQRIILDHLFGASWRERLAAGAPAYKQLTDEQLVRACELARRIDAEGDTLLRELNRASLAWRGKLVENGCG